MTSIETMIAKEPSPKNLRLYLITDGGKSW